MVQITNKIASIEIEPTTWIMTPHLHTTWASSEHVYKIWSTKIFSKPKKWGLIRGVKNSGA